jgi:hypothetical protein
MHCNPCNSVTKNIYPSTSKVPDEQSARKACRIMCLISPATRMFVQLISFAAWLAAPQPGRDDPSPTRGARSALRDSWPQKRVALDDAMGAMDDAVGRCRSNS